MSVALIELVEMTATLNVVVSINSTTDRNANLLLIGQPQGESRSKLCFERGIKNR